MFDDEGSCDRAGPQRSRLEFSGQTLLFKPPEGKILQVLVRDNNVDQALRFLKKKMQREGLFREMKQRRFYEKPSERANREKSEAIRRARKLARKKLQREGLLPDPRKKKLEAAKAAGARPGMAGRPRF